MCELAQKGDFEAIRKMVAGGEDVNNADYDKRTALHLGASEGHFAVVRFLL